MVVYVRDHHHHDHPSNYGGIVSLQVHHQGAIGWCNQGVRCLQNKNFLEKLRRVGF